MAGVSLAYFRSFPEKGNTASSLFFCEACDNLASSSKFWNLLEQKKCWAFIKRKKKEKRTVSSHKNRLENIARECLNVIKKNLTQYSLSISVAGYLICSFLLFD